MKTKKRPSDTAYSKGKNIYKRLRKHLETRYKGKIVAIEPVSGRYVIGRDELDTALKATHLYPGRIFDFFRIGFPVVHKFRKIFAEQFLQSEGLELKHEVRESRQMGVNRVRQGLCCLLSQAGVGRRLRYQSTKNNTPTKTWPLPLN